MIRYVCPKCAQWVEVLAATVPPTCNNTAAHARAQTMVRLNLDKFSVGEAGTETVTLPAGTIIHGRLP